MHNFPERILLATDGSEDAALALRAALDLSKGTGAQLHVVCAWQAFPSYSHPSIAMATDVASYEREAQKVLFEQLDKIEASGASAAGAHLKRGRPAETIAAVAEDVGAGLIVLGSRGLGPVERLVMGSVSEGVVDLASRPVLVVRGGEGAWPPGRVVVPIVQEVVSERLQSYQRRLFFGLAAGERGRRVQVDVLHPRSGALPEQHGDIGSAIDHLPLLPQPLHDTKGLGRSRLPEDEDRPATICELRGEKRGASLGTSSYEAIATVFKGRHR